MVLKKKSSGLRDTVNMMSRLAAVLLVLQMLSAKVYAMASLTANELSLHCAKLSIEPQGDDSQYCIRYIQGFIDGAIATNARVMLNSEKVVVGKETFAERAMRTRMPNRADFSRTASLAGLCLGEPLLLRDVVLVVAADLNMQQNNKLENEPAMEVVYQSLLKNYPCKQ